MKTDISKLSRRQDESDHRIATLEKMISEKASQFRTEVESDRDRTLIVGGLDDYASIDEASKFIKDILWKSWSPTPIDIFSKGDYRNIAFATFSTRKERDEAIKILRASVKEENIWTKEDLAPDQRARRTFLLGIRYVLKSWGFQNIRTDSNLSSLTVGTDKLVDIEIHDFKLTYTWNQSWGNWKEFVEAPEIIEVLKTIHLILDRSSRGKSKGN